MKKQLTILTIVLAAFAAHAQHQHHANETQAQQKTTASFKDENLSVAYDQYLKLKNALVSSNADESKKAAAKLQEALAILPNGNKAIAEVTKITATSDINEQRKAFATLSNEVIALAKAGKVSSGSIFIEYCPMANNNEGAFWLSNEKEIKNPYFGNMMLTCGSVKETLQ